MDRYTIEVTARSELHELPDSWTNDRYRRLLDLAEFEGADELDDADLKDMAVMLVQDLGHQKGGELILEAVFGAAMRPGVRQNLVDDLREDEPWNDIPTLSHQRGVFDAVVLLQQAFPGRFGRPDACRLEIDVTAHGQGGVRGLQNISAHGLIRIVAAGLYPHDTLIRLFGEDIEHGRFLEPECIIWHHEAGETRGQSRTFVLIGSAQWFGSLKRGDRFTAELN